MNDLQILSSILFQQVEIYTQLLRLENEKTRILLNREPGGLDRILNLEQSLTMKSSNLEHDRIALQKKMGIEKLTLIQIINQYDSNNEYDLNSRYLALSRLIKNTETANNLNSRLILSRLKAMRNMFGITDENNMHITYSKEGFVLNKQQV